jgi:hypothetical protein
VTWAAAAQAQAPEVKIPDAGVPQVMTLEGRFVRAAYNNEAYAILGYRLANTTVGDEWMLIEFGTTVRDRTPDYTLRREHLSLSTPDGKTLPLPTIEEYRAAGNATQSLINREKVIRDSINYFPPSAVRGCRIGFFADVDDRGLPWDEVSLSKERACLGRLFFKVPGGSTHGQYFLNVQYAQGPLRIPFRLLTKDEEKLLNKHYGDIKKQVDEAFKPKKK